MPARATVPTLVPDLYPFVLAPRVLDERRFVHDLVTAHGPDRTPREAVTAAPA